MSKVNYIQCDGIDCKETTTNNSELGWLTLSTEMPVSTWYNEKNERCYTAKIVYDFCSSECVAKFAAIITKK